MTGRADPLAVLREVGGTLTDELRASPEAPPLSASLRAALVNQLIEAGGRVVYESGQEAYEHAPCVLPADFQVGTFYLLEDGETPEKFQRSLGFPRPL